MPPPTDGRGSLGVLPMMRRDQATLWSMVLESRQGESFMLQEVAKAAD